MKSPHTFRGDSVIIIGAGGFGREVRETLHDLDKQVHGYIVDEHILESGTYVDDIPVVGGFDWIQGNTEENYVCAIGAPEYKKHAVERVRKNGATRFPNIIHPLVHCQRSGSIQAGNIMQAGVLVTTNVEIRNFVIINLGCTVGHDCVLEDYVTLSPGVHVSGKVTIGEGAFIGTGAVIVEKISIGRWSRVGAGCVVTKDVPANCTVVGIPARVVRTREQGWHLNV